MKGEESCTKRTNAFLHVSCFRKNQFPNTYPRLVLFRELRWIKMF